ncbi:MAG: type IX secretion system membrane protein PorP/SprF [Brumimicrobium sp.]
MKAKIIIILIFVTVGGNISAQQEAQFTQYIDNMLYYNPAYAGSRGAMNINALHRQQWVGIEGAPMTQTLSIHTPLKYESLGLGISVLNDRVGPLNQSWINVDFSYSLRFKNHDGRLAFGLKGGVNLVNGDLSQLYTTDANDPSLMQSYQNKILPNIGAGVYYHSTKWFAGIGVPRIVDNNITAAQISYDDRRHYYAMVGGYFNVNRMLKIRPSLMYKLTTGAPFAIDGNVAFIFYDRFWLGANYRLQESAGGFFQYQLNNQFKLGYAFDISTSSLFRHNFGTHEIMISYDFNFSKEATTTPRYF